MNLLQLPKLERQSMRGMLPKVTCPSLFLHRGMSDTAVGVPARIQES